MRGAMRNLHFQMSDSQQHRLSKALELLAEAPGSYHPSAFVNVGDTVQVDRDSTVLKGHGTQQVNGQLMSTVCGLVERVDQLVTVRPLRARYNAETGDVVVGRITEVGSKRWKVDINFKQDVQLMLSAVNLPGGIQRRRTAVDELNMRSLFEENDLISAEVQSVHSDGSVHLHTRSLKYGKLENGQLVVVASYLVKRLKQHFHQLKQYSISMIIGCNGYIWISSLLEAEQADEFGGTESCSSMPVETGKDPSLSKKPFSLDTREDIDRGAGAVEKNTISLETREKICRFANSVRVLAALGFLIHPDSIVDIYESSLSWSMDIKDMLGAEFYVRTAEREAERRSKKQGFY